MCFTVRVETSKTYVVCEHIYIYIYVSIPLLPFGVGISVRELNIKLAYMI